MGQFCRAGLASFLAGPSLTALAALGFLAFGIGDRGACGAGAGGRYRRAGPSLLPEVNPAAGHL